MGSVERPRPGSGGSDSTASFENVELHGKYKEEEKTDQNQNLSDFMDAEQKSVSNSNLDLSERLRQVESEKIAVIVDHNNMMRTYNERMEIYLHEIRVLQDLNKGLQNDINELRELCCYLDDDRRNCRRVAKEWQKFGRYTVTVMRSEVLSYSEKLNKLETKQTDLIKENSELRDLCLYLDNRRKTEGEQDNQQTENLLKFVICSECKNLRKDNGLLESASSNGAQLDTSRNDHSNSNEYISKLESRIKQLEEERDFFITTFASKKDKKDRKRVSFCMPEDDCDSSSLSEQDRAEATFDFPIRSPLFKDNQHGILRNGFLSPPPRRENSKTVNLSNESSNRVTQAMRVLEIQEKLDRGSTSSTGSEDQMTEQEVAILKQMCSAAWSKLGDDKQVPLPSMLPQFNSTNHETVTSSRDSQTDNSPEESVLQDLC